MADWFIATEGVKVVKDSASLWPQIITAVTSAGAALGGVWFTHHLTSEREKRATAEKARVERQYITTELVFLLERYAVSWMSLKWMSLNQFYELNAIPVLDISLLKGDWRTLPVSELFRLRSLEVNQALLASRIQREKDSLHHPAVSDTLTQDCLKTGIRAYILAAKLRRAAGLPDAEDLKNKEGILGTLRSSHKESWHRFVLVNRRAKKSLEDMRRPRNDSPSGENSDGSL